MAGVGVSGSELPARSERLTECFQFDMSFEQSHALSSYGGGVLTTVWGQKHMTGAVIQVD